MKLATITIALLQKASAAIELPDYIDYPTQGENFEATLMGKRTRSLETRQILHRKRLINSQITSKSYGDAWYFHYHNYGCYCVAPSDSQKGKGKPVDQIDSACKRHTMCYSCAFSDYSDARRDCNPKQMGYKYSINRESGGNFKIDCKSPPDTCAYATCMCDKALAEELGNLAMKGTLTNREYRNYDAQYCTSQSRSDQVAPEGVFFDDMSGAKFENIVQLLDGGGSDSNTDYPRECCGVYPQRFPFKSSTHECCSAGLSTEELKPLGTC